MGRIQFLLVGDGVPTLVASLLQDAEETSPRDPTPHHQWQQSPEARAAVHATLRKTATLRSAGLNIAACHVATDDAHELGELGALAGRHSGFSAPRTSNSTVRLHYSQEYSYNGIGLNF